MCSTPSTLRTLKAELKDLPMTHKDYSKAQTVHHEPQCTSRLVAELIGHPPIAEFLQALMGPDIVFTHGLFTRTLSGSPGISMHTDGQPFGSSIFGFEGSSAAPFAGALLPRRPAARARALPAHPALPSLVPRPSQPVRALCLAPTGNHALRQGRFSRHDTRPPLPRHPSQQGLGPSGTDPVRLPASLGRAQFSRWTIGTRNGWKTHRLWPNLFSKAATPPARSGNRSTNPKACSATHRASIQTAGGTKV